MQGEYVKIKSIEESEPEDVFCLSIPDTGNFVANGMVIANCDALRYACYTAFPSGQFSHPDENLTIEQVRRNIYGSDNILGFNNSGGSYQ